MRGDLCVVEYVAYGVCFRLVAESDELLDRMEKCVPWGGQVLWPASSLKTSAASEFALLRSGAGFRLTGDGTPKKDAAELEEVLEALSREVMVHVAEYAPDRAFVHAGVVVWRGRALILPGKTFAGKSTLVAALVRAGAIYYSDEYAVIDAAGRVHPYARELQMREPGGIAQRPLQLSELKGHAGVEAVAVSHVVFTEYAECGKWNPQAMSPGCAVLGMMEHAIAVQRAPARVMSALAKMMEKASAWRSERGDAALTAALVLQAMSTESGR